ncbi:hypothetical protein CWI36_2463p0010 [Hamiltosporidium magnivora]|uniref:Uncharacterized protein n=1 Tax=Hamiltosporidium magnivora TaxID=148818 RepID=A0A4Q9KU38_9MICR|nr:hypothetical protein CWI36_2463p0010 [Hamiltosporidium magnivora]
MALCIFMIICIVEATMFNEGSLNGNIPGSEIINDDYTLHNTILFAKSKNPTNITKNMNIKNRFNTYKYFNDLWVQDLENKVKKAYEKIKSKSDTDLTKETKKDFMSEFKIYENDSSTRNKDDHNLSINKAFTEDLTFGEKWVPSGKLIKNDLKKEILVSPHV